MDGKIFVTRRIRDAGLDLLREAGVELRVWPGPENARPSREEVLEGARWADVLLSLLTEPIDREVMAANPRLRGVANFAVGFDNIDILVATELGVPVSNTPGVLTDTTADLTWALLLCAARNVASGDVYMRGGRYKVWGPNLLLGEDDELDINRARVELRFADGMKFVVTFDASAKPGIHKTESQTGKKSLRVLQLENARSLEYRLRFIPASEG